MKAHASLRMEALRREAHSATSKRDIARRMMRERTSTSEKGAERRRPCIVEQIAEAHGGTVPVESSVEQTVFTIRLPDLANGAPDETAKAAGHTER
jgi:hypothetical protein